MACIAPARCSYHVDIEASTLFSRVLEDEEKDKQATALLRHAANALESSTEDDGSDQSPKDPLSQAVRSIITAVLVQR